MKNFNLLMNQSILFPLFRFYLPVKPISSLTNIIKPTILRFNLTLLILFSDSFLFPFLQTLIAAALPQLIGRKMARNSNRIIHAKLVLLGDMGTGKTSMVLRFVKGQFFEHQESTIGAAFFTQILSLPEATVKFDIWDTAGQERYHSLAPMYYRGASAAVIVYDISSADTFERAKKWVQELKRQGNTNLVMALVGNKSDLEPHRREVEFEEGHEFSQENEMLFIETSAKTSLNINELFYEVAKRLGKATASPEPIGLMKLHKEPQKKTALFCCSVG